jgi:hypothetical protein
MTELLELLKNHPELVHALVFNPTKVKRVLKSKSARKLVRSVHTKTFLRRIAGHSEDGGPIARCGHGTKHLCPKGTRAPNKMAHFAHCVRGTWL